MFYKKAALLMAQTIYAKKDGALQPTDIPSTWNCKYRYPLPTSISDIPNTPKCYLRLSTKRDRVEIMERTEVKSLLSGTESNGKNAMLHELKRLSAEVQNAVLKLENMAYVLTENKLGIFNNIWKLTDANGKILGQDKLAQIKTFSRKWINNIISARSDERAKRYLSFHNADPAILFPFLQQKEIVRDSIDLKSLYAQSLTELNRLCPLRGNESQVLLKYIFRKLVGDKNCVTPLLLGGPGTGKSEIARQAGAALSSAGVPRSVLFQSMTSSNGRNSLNQTEMNLLGSDAHFSNADSGSIYKESMNPNSSLCLVVLDEADKHDNCYDLIINLLDPKQPLQDICQSSVCNMMDMRSKVFFILTANDDRPLKSGPSDPLWSRLASIYFRPYTEVELIELLTLLAERDYNDVNAYSYTHDDYHHLAKKIAAMNGCHQTFRHNLNQMGDFAISRELDLPTQQQHSLNKPAKPKIGF